VIELFRGLVLGHLRTNKLRALVTLIAVALGVAISLAIDLANATAVASFASSVNVIASNVNLQIVGLGRGFDEHTLPRVQNLAGVQYAGPTIEDSIVVGAKRGDPFSGEILRILGVDLLRPLPRGNTVTQTDPQSNGSAPDFVAPAASGPDPYALIAGRGAIISQRIATKFHLRVGSTLTGLAGDRTVHLHVQGILPSGIAGLDTSVVFVDIVTAQELFEKVGNLDRIDLVVDPARRPALEKQIATLIPHGTRVIEPAVRTNEIKRMLRSFQLNLAALSYVALLVGAFLIYNTVAISVVQRRPEIGTLRAIGTTRGEIFRTFVGEGALFGFFGSILGMGLGAVLAVGSVGAVSRTVDALYVASHADGVVFAPLVFLKAFIVGIVIAMLSAVAPAIEAANTPPAIAMRGQGFEGRPSGAVERVALAGAALYALAYALTFLPAFDGIPIAGYTAGLAIVFGTALCTPLAISLAARLGRKLVGTRFASALIGTTNFGASVRRNAVAVSSLGVAIAMMIAVAVLVGSFRITVVAWADETLKADLFVKPLGLADASYDSRFSPNIATKLRAVPGVEAVDAFRAISLPFRGSITTLASVDLATIAARNKLRLIGGDSAQAISATLPNTTGALVSEPFATRFGVKVGDVIPIDTPAGLAKFHVAAIYNDYSSDAGIFMIDTRTFKRLFHDDSENSLAIYAKPGVDLADLRTRLIRAVLPLRIDVETTRELRKLVIAIFNRTFAITYALYIISIAIAVLGVVSTLFALVLERKRDIGLLRYLGFTIRDVRSMVLYEAAYVGALGGLTGIASGLLLALLLIFVINRQAFGWLIELHIPWDFLAESFGLVIVVALVAGIYPSNVAARIRTADAVRAE
jgi:putative ABC transport system permease protein